MTAEEVRAAMPADMVRILDVLKARFGSGPAYVETPTLTMGLDLETDEGWRKYRTKQSIKAFMEAQRAT